MAVLSLANLLWSLLILFFMIVYFIMLYSGDRRPLPPSRRVRPEEGGLVRVLAGASDHQPDQRTCTSTVTASPSARSIAPGRARRRSTPTIARPITNRSAAAQIEHSKRLLEAGVIGQEEYDKLKGHALEYGA
jgi:hypothetical protein